MRKYLLPFALFIALFVVAGCSSSRKIFVEHDYSYETNFKDYSSYTFLECERDTNNLCTEIYEAIRRQMQVRGYKLTAEKPTLLVNYGIFYDNLRYQRLHAASDQELGGYGKRWFSLRTHQVFIG